MLETHAEANYGGVLATTMHSEFQHGGFTHASSNERSEPLPYKKCRKHVGYDMQEACWSCLRTPPVHRGKRFGHCVLVVLLVVSRGGLLVVFWGCALGGLPVVVMVTVVLVVNVVVDMDVVVICHWRTVWSWDCRDSDPRIWPLESCGVLSNENLVFALEGGRRPLYVGIPLKHLLFNTMGKCVKRCKKLEEVIYGAREPTPTLFRPEPYHPTFPALKSLNPTSCSK